METRHPVRVFISPRLRAYDEVDPPHTYTHSLCDEYKKSDDTASTHPITLSAAYNIATNPTGQRPWSVSKQVGHW